MSVDAVPAKTSSPVFAFLFLTALGIGFSGVGLILGTEPRLALERKEDGSFRVTGSNYFAVYRFFSKTIDGVTGLVVDNAVRDQSHDRAKVNRKRRRDLHLEFSGSNGAQVSWSRKSDTLLIEEFMRGKEPTLSLSDKPPLWKSGIAWFSVALGSLTFLGAIQSFLPTKKT